MNIIKDKIFQSQVCWIYEPSRTKSLEQLATLEKKLKAKCDSIREAMQDKHCYGACAQLESGISILWAVDDVSLVHEIVHAVSDILKYKGIPLADSTEECYAYYVAWIYEEITRKKR